ncbi:MAG: Holliday junction branch migration protein RuvA [Oscillospiraceae bacterium]|nr:Holliday junction branch migration protein RuvA [Oscillospiraceae bacterium]
MIYSLNGDLIKKTSTFVVIDCAGVGYKCFVTASTSARLGAIGKKVKIYTHFSVKEDAFELFGFLHEQELECFKMLVSVSGVGAKFALSILATLLPEEVIKSIQVDDVKAFTAASGVGTKLSQRIILELKNKVQKEFLHANLDFKPSELGSNFLEALGALESLGYSRAEAIESVKGCDGNGKVEDVVKFGLKNLTLKRWCDGN